MELDIHFEPETIKLVVDGQEAQFVSLNEDGFIQIIKNGKLEFRLADDVKFENEFEKKTLLRAMIE